MKRGVSSTTRLFYMRIVLAVIWLFVVTAATPGPAAAARISGVLTGYQSATPLASRDLHFENVITGDIYLSAFRWVIPGKPAVRSIPARNGDWRGAGEVNRGGPRQCRSWARQRTSPVCAAALMAIPVYRAESPCRAGAVDRLPDDLRQNTLAIHGGSSAQAGDRLVKAAARNTSVAGSEHGYGNGDCAVAATFAVCHHAGTRRDDGSRALFPGTGSGRKSSGDTVVWRGYLMAVRAIIFDLDGTLADTEQLHFEAFNTVLRPLGIEIGLADYFSRLIGYDDHDCFTLLLGEHRQAANDALVNELIAEKAGVYQAMIAERQVLYPGAGDFVQRCAARFPLALVTGTLRAEAEMILDKANLRALFTEIIAAEDVEHGKPAPDGFNLALSRLHFILCPQPAIPAAECVVIEDTPAGIAAAQRAGMRVLAVAQTAPASELAAADLIRGSLAETDLDDLLRRFAGLV
jgi:beta-phosphoglucomutase